MTNAQKRHAVRLDQKLDAQACADSIGQTVYLFSNGDHAAKGSTLAAELHATGMSSEQVRPQ